MPSRRRAKRDAYRAKLTESLHDTAGRQDIGEELLYGIIYLFSLRDGGYDADNISKPVWDALKGIAFGDDAQIRIRIAGVVDLKRMDLADLNLTGVHEATVERLVDLLGKESHVLYIEVGALRVEHYRFGIGMSEP